MKKEDVKIGMKVVPFQKTMGHGFKELFDYGNGMFFKENGYLYVITAYDRYASIGIQGTTSQFSYEDFEPYIETQQTKKEEQKVSKITPQELTKREKGRKVKDFHQSLGIEKVIVNNPVVIVFFNDGTKQVEKCVDKGAFNVDCGIALAVLHHKCGSKAIFKDVVKKILK